MMDVGLRRYIHHSNTRDILKILADVVDTRSMIILSGKGDPATGKGRLLRYFAEDYWRNECNATVDWEPIVYVDHESLDWSTSLLQGNKVPIVARVLSATMTELGSLAERYRPHKARLRWQQKPRSIKTPSQTVWLNNEVYRELKNLRVRALLIDNAQSIDGPTLQVLVQTRKRLQNNGYGVALILAARLAKNEQIDEPMEHIFARAKIDPRDFEVPVELKALTQDEFFDNVLNDFFDDLEVVFDSSFEEKHEAYIAETVWERTQGDWKSIDQQAKKFNRLLGRRDGTSRLVTRAIMEQVLGKKLPK